MRTPFATRLCALVLLISCAVSVSAQDTPSLAPSHDVDQTELEIRLRPLTKEQLAESATAWQAALQARVQQVSEGQVQLTRATDEAKAAIREQLKVSRAERDAIIARMGAVLAEYTNKGATEDEVGAFQSYIDAVSDRAVAAVEDPFAAWEQLQDWVISPDGGIGVGLNLVAFIGLLIAFKILSAVAAGIVKRSISLSKVETSDLLKNFFVNMTRKIVFFIGLIVALPFIGLNVGPFLAAIGAAGLILGFALQESLSNFAAGIMILLYRPYDVGHWVEVAGISGKVHAMSIVSTTLKKSDNQTVIVPNGSIWGGIITNVTGSDTRRVNLVFGIGYKDDIAKAQRVLEEVVTQHPLVLKDPSPTIRVHELAESSVNFVCRPWTKTSDHWDVKCDLTRQVKERFDAEGLSIPYPQTDVHVHNVS